MIHYVLFYRMVNGNKPLPHGGGSMGSARPGLSPSLHRRFVSSPKLTPSIVSNRVPWNNSPPISASRAQEIRNSRAPDQVSSKGTAKLSSASSASNHIRKEQRQKAELYGTLPKRKTQSQSGKPSRELPKTPTEKKSSLTKDINPEKKVSRTKSVDKSSPSKKISSSSVQSNDENKNQTPPDEPEIQREPTETQREPTEDKVEEKIKETRSNVSSRKTSSVLNLDDVPVPASLSRQDNRASKAGSGATSPGTHMERDSLSPEPKEHYKFTHDKATVVNHTGKVFEHTDIVRHGYNAFFSIEKTNPFDTPSQKSVTDENFNNIQTEAEKIVGSIENSREKTPSVVDDDNRKSLSRKISLAEDAYNTQNRSRNISVVESQPSQHQQNRSRNVSVAESNHSQLNRALSTVEVEQQNQSRTTSVAESRRSQTPQRSRSQVSGATEEILDNDHEVRDLIVYLLII